MRYVWERMNSMHLWNSIKAFYFLICRYRLIHVGPTCHNLWKILLLLPFNPIVSFDTVIIKLMNAIALQYPCLGIRKLKNNNTE